MQSVINGKWRKLDGTPIKIPIMEAVEKALISEAELDNKIKVCIGTDSQVYSGETEFATVILFLRKGRGGYMYINTDRSTQRM
ncbi:ribonuclease H-like YkuK family protein, partial [Salmonella enterica]|uniref:ribonuclease H-like YkuK family protein n=1 Tax=Salmonella enterica TaxID=28901 RepID=UPI003D295EC4